MIIFRFFKALFNAIIAFFKAYDHTTGITEQGYPTLEGWPKDLDPYEFFQRGIKAHDFSEISGAFVFTQGKEVGEVEYLKDGDHKLGTSCRSDIVVTTHQLNERQLNIHVSKGQVILKSEYPDAPLQINGNVSNNTRLVDQDECHFNGSTFYYLEFSR